MLGSAVDKPGCTHQFVLSVTFFFFFFFVSQNVLKKTEIPVDYFGIFKACFALKV
jgi:hypothetical protein